MKHPRKHWTVPKLSGIYGSYRLTNREERRKARHDLHDGVEPQPRIYSRKHWND